jgi:hypothetical protein
MTLKMSNSPLCNLGKKKKSVKTQLELSVRQNPIRSNKTTPSLYRMAKGQEHPAPGMKINLKKS